MLQFADDKYLHSANVLMCVGGLVTATGGIAAGGAAVAAIMSVKEIMRRLPPEAKPIAEDIAKRLRHAVEGDPHLTVDTKALIPQMIVVSAPVGDTIIACGRDASRVLAEMCKVLKEMRDQPEFGQERHLGPFVRIVGPILTDLLDNPTLSAQLSPHMDRAMLAMRDELHGVAATGKDTNESVHELKGLMAAFLDAQASGNPALSGISLEDLRKLAVAFGGDPEGKRDLFVSFLADKSQEYQSYRQTIAALDDRVAAIANLKGAAQDAAEQLDFEEVETLLSRVNVVELEIAATTFEARASNALLRGRVEQAHALLSACADSFAAVDPLEPARRRLIYETVLQEYGVRYGGPGISFAARMARSVFLTLQKGDDPQLWSMHQNNLANALDYLGKHTAGAEGIDLFKESIAAHSAALEVIDEENDLLGWAMTMQNRANTRRDLADRVRGSDGIRILVQAIGEYSKVLNVLTGDEFRFERAFVQTNRGEAFHLFGKQLNGEQGTRMLHSAIKDFNLTLEVFTPDEEIVEWSRAKQDAALSLRALGDLDTGLRGINFLKQAVATLREVIKVLVKVKEEHPMALGVVNGNLANTLMSLGGRTPGAAGVELLCEAERAQDEALNVYLRAGLRVQWAMAQENMANLQVTWSRHEACTDPVPHLSAALDHVQAALTVFDPEHMAFNHNKASELQAEILATLDRLTPKP